MRLVLFFTDGDGCSWSADTTLPFEWESAEAAIVEFERACKTAFAERQQTFMFAGHELSPDAFYPRDSYLQPKYQAPSIMTVDEWFENYGGQ
jgi:hypothetical protein